MLSLYNKDEYTFGGIAIELVRWSYSGRKLVRGYFNKFPNSTFYFRRIQRFYILYSLDWCKDDPVLEDEDREEMQQLINEILGREKEYQKRKSRGI